MTTCRIRRVASATASITVVAFLTAISGAAQEPDKSTDMAPAPDKVELPKRVLPADFALTKTGEATIRGQRVPYRVTTGTQPVYGEDGATIAALH